MRKHRDANRNADAERLGSHSLLRQTRGLSYSDVRMQRQNSYLRARPCLSTPRVVTREPLEVVGNGDPRYMTAPILSAVGSYKIECLEQRREADPSTSSGCSILYHLRWARSAQNPAYRRNERAKRKSFAFSFPSEARINEHGEYRRTKKGASAPFFVQ